jgi:hypothetical protein
MLPGLNPCVTTKPHFTRLHHHLFSHKYQLSNNSHSVHVGRVHTFTLRHHTIIKLAGPRQHYNMDSISTIPSEKSTLALLQAENASLKAELHALRENRTQRAPRSDPTCHFFRLPREIRNTIYELCVVPGKVFISRPDHIPFLLDLDWRYTKGRRGAESFASQLFLVNTEIRLEALEVFLSMNQFVTSGPCLGTRGTLPHRIMARIPGHRDDSSPLLHHLRSISVSLNSIEAAPSVIMVRRVRLPADEYEYSLTDGYAEPHGNHTRQRHGFITHCLTIRFAAVLGELFEFPGRLRRIQVNLQATSCPLGCHRLVRQVFSTGSERLAECFAVRADNDLLESLDFLGTMSDKEREAIRLAFPSYIREKITFHGTYNRRQAEWNPISRVHTPDMTGHSDYQG